MSTLAPTRSHRERKKLATRQAIHDAAFELAEELGLAQTTVEAISERAGVAPRTFWAYFSSKENAVLNRPPDQAAGLRAALLGRPAAEDVVTALKVILGDLVHERTSDSARALRRQQLVRREPQLMSAVAADFDRFERELVSAVAERTGTDPVLDMRPALLVMVACGACRVAQQRWSDLGGRQPFPELMDEAFRGLAAVLAEPAARRVEVAG